MEPLEKIEKAIKELTLEIGRQNKPMYIVADKPVKILEALYFPPDRQDVGIVAQAIQRVIEINPDEKIFIKQYTSEDNFFVIFLNSFEPDIDISKYTHGIAFNLYNQPLIRKVIKDGIL